MIKSFFNKNKIEYKENISLKNYNTYKIDSTCSYMVFPKNREELIKVLREIKKEKTKYLVLGNGSNVIFSSSHYDGIIIKLDNLCKVKYKGNIVTAEAGYPLIKLAIETIDRGLSGLTFATGIPGNVGASTAMNAGAYNKDMASVVKSVEVLTDKLEIKTLTNKELNYSYRDSFLKKHREYIVLSTTLELEPGDIEFIKNQITERRKKRLASQPLNMPNAGSVFRNHPDMYAGELIEKLNLKGYTIGGAKISEKHANFIVNNGNATGKDIIELIKKIEEEVKKEYKVELKLEQIIIK